MGVPSSPLADAFGRKFLISAVARVMRPGCKVDHVLIFEGLRGTMKSKTLRALVGDDWFTDQISDLGTKDWCQDLRGVWVIELSELSAIRPGEVEKVKAYISRQVDHYRPSYGRRTIDVPRQRVFIGTTNAREYLSDITGNRRYWPVTCVKLDLDATHRDREQIWAVAAYHAVVDRGRGAASRSGGRAASQADRRSVGGHRRGMARQPVRSPTRKADPMVGHIRRVFGRFWAAERTC
jgi:putative DNA primase/helicase